MRSLTVAFVLMLVTSLTTSAWASCIADAAMPAKAQMACCKAGHDKCPMHGSAKDCCKTEGQKQQQLSAATHEIARSPVSTPALTATISPVALPSAVVAPNFAPQHDVLKGPSGPTYLLISALLI